MLAVLTTGTLHYVGFFSTLADDYFIIMTPSLVRRVFWELVSTLAQTSMWMAVIFLLSGIAGATASGLLRAFQPKLIEKRRENPVDFLRIARLYLIVLFVLYFPLEAPILVGLAYILLTFVLFELLYGVLFSKLDGDTKWTRFARELRRPDLAVYAVVATLLVLAFMSGKGLAWKLMETEPRTILTTTGELQATVIDGSDLGFLLMTDGGIILMPLHEIRQIKLADPK